MHISVYGQNDKCLLKKTPLGMLLANKLSDLKMRFKDETDLISGLICLKALPLILLMHAKWNMLL